MFNICVRSMIANSLTASIEFSHHFCNWSAVLLIYDVTRGLQLFAEIAGAVAAPFQVQKPLSLEILFSQKELGKRDSIHALII